MDKITKPKNYMVLDAEGVHEYDIKVEETKKGTKASLYYSNGDQWTSSTKGTLAMSIIDHGNGVKLSKKVKDLDYSELVHVRILINFEYKTDPSPLNSADYTVVRKKKKFNV